MFRFFSLIVALAVANANAAINECMLRLAGVACAAPYPKEAHNCLSSTNIASEWCCKDENWDHCGTGCVSQACGVCTKAGTGCALVEASTCGAGFKLGACEPTAASGAASGAWQKASLGLLAMVLPFVVAA